MNTNLREIQEIETILVRAMIALVVRDPNGLLKIEQALHSVKQAGIDMTYDL